ncbi:MAG: CoA-binding protein [Myxococcales bacterium]|nr:CoA-binding protein [Myxococcales bacterium]MDH3483249.1 CoA-binding protein [Myxococcales bacterium]
MSEVRWLRASYWVGAIADAMAGVLMLFPDAATVVYGITGFEPGPDYHYAMGLGASLMLGWTVLLLWADQRPVERRGILLITVFVIFGMALAGAYAVDSGLMALPRMIPTWVFQAFLVVLFSYSYWRSRAAVAAKGEGTTTLAAAAAEFLSQGRFAVAGVSRAGNSPANLIYRKLKEGGRQVFATNPNAETVEGDPCYRSLLELPERVDAVVIATHPDKSIEVARQCKEAGVHYVWFHRSIDGGSVSDEALAFCRDYGAFVIPGGCPMMHLMPVDFGHRCMRGVLNLTGRLPKEIT